MNGSKLKLFAGTSNPGLAQGVADFMGLPLADMSVTRFPDGELDVKIHEDVRGTDAYIIQSTCPPVNENLMELLIITDCLRRASAMRITAVIPYYGYARKDRKDDGRVPITAKLAANLITKAGVNRVLAVDLHASQIQGFFDIPVDHLFASKVLCEHFSDMDLGDLVLVSPDVGGIKMTRACAKRLHGGLAIVDKRRISPDRAEVYSVIGDVENKTAILVDDIIATAGTISEAASILKKNGAKDIYVMGTHPIFADNAVKKLINAPIKDVVVTDTIPLGKYPKEFHVKVMPIAPLLGEAIQRIYCNESVSALFE